MKIVQGHWKWIICDTYENVTSCNSQTRKYSLTKGALSQKFHSLAIFISFKHLIGARIIIWWVSPDLWPFLKENKIKMSHQVLQNFNHKLVIPFWWAIMLFFDNLENRRVCFPSLQRIVCTQYTDTQDWMFGPPYVAGWSVAIQPFIVNDTSSQVRA